MLFGVFFRGILPAIDLLSSNALVGVGSIRVCISVCVLKCHIFCKIIQYIGVLNYNLAF